MVGSDATVDECNEFVKRIDPDANVTATSIEMFNAILQEREPGKRLFSKLGNQNGQLYLMSLSAEGRHLIKQLVVQRFSQDEILQMLGTRLPLSVDYSKKPAKVAWRFSRPKPGTPRTPKRGKKRR